ncbi:N-terminal kinase-like protein [Oopsacas minuta]|uniref:N-terminal kinase-like protein n=1 Tax=Oopsacas minuta TaxID=111878 RepID=A0AAV7JK32_9METZ|nr:N-terminal kinase-like protein [Oopsacas minuta]
MFSKVSSYLWGQGSTGPPGYEMMDVISDKLSLWILHSGVKKQTKEELSIFVCDLKTKSPSQIIFAKNTIQKLKTLKHPNILRYIDSSENPEFIFLITEPVLPLSIALNDSSIVNCYGIYSIAKVLAFLNEDCNSVVGDLGLKSLFVSPGLDWKLGGFEYFSKFSPELLETLPKNEVFSPPEVTNSTGRTTQHLIDAWGLGCIVWEVHNGALSRPGQLKNLGTIPSQLASLTSHLLNPRPGNRLSIRAFLERGEEPEGYFNSWYVKVNKWIEEIQILSADQRQTLYETITDKSDWLEPGFCRHKALPMLVHAFDFCAAQSLVLQPLLKIGCKVEESEYQTKIVPCLVKMFVSPDRATRISLLQTISSYVAFLTTDVVSNQIYPHLVHGFNDTSIPIREHTIQAVGVLAPKLSSALINQNLLKCLAKSQMDAQPGIRYKTNLCLGKLAPFLDKSTRSKVLCSAYTRGLKDTDTHARGACLSGLQEGTRYVTANDMANLVIPSLSPYLLDPDETFRDRITEIITHLVQTVSSLAGDPEALKQQTIDTGVGDNTWASWAIGSISGLYNKSKPVAPSSDTQTEPQIPTEIPKDEPIKLSQGPLKLATHYGAMPINNEVKEASNEADSASDYEGDGWGNDDWQSMPVDKSVTKVASGKADGWEDFEVVGKDNEIERKRKERKLRNQLAREKRGTAGKPKGMGGVKKCD